MNRERQIERIENYESLALKLGDLKTGIKLNWLRNALRFDNYDVIQSVEKMQEIVYNTPLTGGIK